MHAKLRLEKKEEFLIARLEGEIDNSVTKGYREKIDQLVLYDDYKYLILDFKDVSFVDSSGIGFIIGRYNLMKREQGYIFLSGLNEFCMKIFKISGILRLINSFSSVEDVINEVRDNESYRVKI